MSEAWETVSVEPCVLRPGEKAGWVYFIACTETLRCKIGYTSGDVEKRMKSLQTGAAGKLRLIAKHPGTQDTERRVHERFTQHRLHGEWFEMNEDLFTYIALTIWLMSAIIRDEGLKPELWIIAGLRMLKDCSDNPLPPEFEAMIA